MKGDTLVGYLSRSVSLQSSCAMLMMACDMAAIIRRRLGRQNQKMPMLHAMRAKDDMCMGYSTALVCGTLT